MLLLILGSFAAGILTVLAPCVLPLLPVIIGGSLSGATADKRDTKKPLIIAASLALSLFIFTLLLKATTLFINIPPQAITYVSGSIIIVLGIVTLFPQLYTTAMARLGIEHRAQKLLGNGTSNHSRYIGPILTGAALGPVFSSCSPVYGYIIATVLPVQFSAAIIYIIAYILGLALVMLAVGFYGRRLTSRLKFASNPRGVFQRSLAVLFIVVGIFVITGLGIKVQTYAADHLPFKFDALSAKLLPASSTKVDNSKLFNVAAYPAPELTGLQHWINSDPQTIKQLKGSVVLVDFWTYSCINCIRSLPYVEGWYSHYQRDGLVVLGIHAPEFSFEQVPANVEQAVKERNITYPVALDNSLLTWTAFKNQYWPAEYLIDRAGQIRRVHFGEGEYDQTEQAIRALLKEGSKAQLSNTMVTPGPSATPIDPNQTPETYLGGSRANTYGGTPALAPGTQAYTFPAATAQNMWSLSGKWTVNGEKITAAGSSKLRISVAAKNVYVVGGSSGSSEVAVSLDGKNISTTNAAGPDVQNGVLAITSSKLYRIASFPSFSNGVLELSVPDGTDLNAFTFGN
jgi:cytochrome c biogenesis protein CcdA/thiol-disulfide isomerase/thioredoxin